MTHHRPIRNEKQRDGIVNALRKSFGDAPDSPTIGYYRELPDDVLCNVTEKSSSMQTHMISDGVISYTSALLACGSLMFDAKYLAGAFAVASVGFAIDAVRTHGKHEQLKQWIFGEQSGRQPVKQPS